MSHAVITVGCDSLTELADRLDSLSYRGAEWEARPTDVLDIESGSWSVRTDVDESAPTGDEYVHQINEWWHGDKAARRGV